MKIYFSAAVCKVTPEIRSNYQIIIDALKILGHNVSAEHLKGKTAEYIKNQTEEEALEVQRQMTKRKKQADMVVLEASTPSFGVGQELTFALENKKPVIVLHVLGKEPHLLQDEGQESLFIAEYTRETVKQVLRELIEDARNQMDVRFNFFISPRIVAYLDWISKKKKLPRAVLIRRLIEDHMKRNKEYKG